MKTEDNFPKHLFVDTDQMIEVDRSMIEDFNIELIQMMENAGRNLAALARERFLDGDPRARKVTVLAGPGGNGGGALVCARRLQNWGAHVTVVLSRPSDSFTPIPAHQLKILKNMGVTIISTGQLHDIPAPELIIDGLIGYSLRGAPRGDAAVLIRWANAQPSTPILALDAPSGVDTTSGTVFQPAIKASATLTLALPKKGLLAPGIETQTGELYLGDISVPPKLYGQPGLNLPTIPIFARSDILRLR
jgi:NAD(P)H-hydrate epimerase